METTATPSLFHSKVSHRHAFRPIMEAWVISESPLWRTWVGALLEKRGLVWRAFSWNSWEKLSLGPVFPELVLTDGSQDHRAMADGVLVVDAGEELGDPWDAVALENALDASGIYSCPPDSGTGDPATRGHSEVDQLGQWYLQAGRRAVNEIAENLARFRAAQPGPINGEDYLSEARDRVRRMEWLNDTYAAGSAPAPAMHGESPLWPSVEAAFDIACMESSWTWHDSMPRLLPDVAVTRWPMEKALESLAAAMQKIAAIDEVVVEVSAREQATGTWRHVELECRGLPHPVHSNNPDLAEALLEVAARMGAAGGRFEVSPSGGWRCLFPVHDSAVLRNRESLNRLRRVLVIASDAVESSILCQLAWRKGHLAVPVTTVSRGAALAASASVGRSFDAAVIADGPAARPCEESIFLGLMMPIVVLAQEETEARKWLDVPGVSRVLAAPASPSEAMDLLAQSWED